MDLPLPLPSLRSTRCALRTHFLGLRDQCWICHHLRAHGRRHRRVPPRCVPSTRGSVP
ncbi:hypothetical protein Ahy_A02g006563 isoform A [Arachis hypogaea]|uniref:Uncharacterized protein n=1 Tax=Arachis hypogaea TaxID=3818 RepID=A0A445EA04_ARAHY|nr:hypothetical protein Ahy_A02g006563 isoform A [Arachis hypogaea]